MDAMSEDKTQNTERRSELLDNTRTANRRSVLKSLGAAGTTAAIGTTVGAGALSGVAAAENGDGIWSDYEVLETNELTSAAATQEKAAILSNDRMGTLTGEMEAQHNLVDKGVFSLEIVTNKSEINESAPRVNILSFAPDDIHSGSAVGVSIVLTIDTAEDSSQQNRQPVAGQVHVIEEPTADSSVTISSQSNKKDRISYGIGDDGKATVAERSQIELPANDSQTVGNGVSTQGVSEALIALCGGSCTLFVSSLCSGVTGNIGLTRCANVCVRFLTNPPVALSCSAACGAFVRAINKRGCDVGAGSICAGVCSEI